jgi:hypothetical protein
MAYEIRAMSLGEIVDTAFRILRDHFAPLVGMSAAIYVPFYLLMAGWQIQAQKAVAAGGPGQLSAALVPLVVMLLVFSVVVPIVSAAISYAVSEAYLGRPIDAGAALRASFAIVVPLVGTGLLAGLLGALATLAFIIPGIWFFLGIFTLYPINVIERSFGMTAIRRSLDLMKGQRGRGALLYLLIIAVSMVLGFAFGLLGAISPWVGALMQGASQAITGAFTAAAMIVFYFDVRCRKEAFDVEHLARLVQAGATAGA